MKIKRPSFFLVVAGISCRIAFANALSFAVALVARTALFVSDFHAMHSANVIGFPFLGHVDFVCYRNIDWRYIFCRRIPACPAN